MPEPKVRITDTAAYEAACDEVGQMLHSWSQRHPGDEPLLVTAMLHTSAVFLAALYGPGVIPDERIMDIRNGMLLAARRAALGGGCG